MLRKLTRGLGIALLLSIIIIPISIVKKSHHHKRPSTSPPPPPSSLFPSPPQPPPPPPPSPTMPPPSSSAVEKLRNLSFLFPPATSAVLPDPSRFFSPRLLSAPLPTNSFFQNFVLKKGDQPEYIHPYLLKPSSPSSSPGGLSLCYPSSPFSNPTFTYQNFVPDLTISSQQNPNRQESPSRSHLVSAFGDLSVTLDFPDADLRFFLVRGSPFLTFAVTGRRALSISTIHAVLSVSPNAAGTKHAIALNNGQTWLLYSSSPVYLGHEETSRIVSGEFSGIIRIAILPDSRAGTEDVLDLHSSCYPVSGDALLGEPFAVEYKWEKRGWGDLLMLAHPLHLRLLSGNVTVLDEFRFKSIDGELVGVVGDCWSLKMDPISVSWHSMRGIKEEAFPEIIAALSMDVEALNPGTISTDSSYFYGKLVARAARLVLIAEEVSYPQVIPAVRVFLRETITPWLDGTFGRNGFLYDRSWRGIVSIQGSKDAGADFGFGIFNDHHYHLGYFLYGIAVLAKIDPAWGRRYRPQAYSLMADFMTLGRRSDSHYPRLRCFDLWKLHSWAGGLTEFADGRNQESTSEAVNAYYSAALMGLAYGDTHLMAIGSTLAAMEIHSAQTWWHVNKEDTKYGEEFTENNRLVGVLWANKRDSGLWFAPPEWKECRLGIQVLPLLPITEVLFSDVEFVEQLVKWTLPALEREGVGEGWKGFVYALEGIYNKEDALQKIKNLSGHDDGSTLTNMLWWIHSRVGDEEEGCQLGGKYCWFAHYSQ